MRVSSHIYQQLPWLWYEISIVILFYCHSSKKTAAWKSHATSNHWSLINKLRSWILRKTGIVDFRHWLHPSATRRLIKFLEFQSKKLYFYKDQRNIESSWVYAELTDQITTRLPVHSTTTSRWHLPQRTNFKKILIRYFVIEFRLLVELTNLIALSLITKKWKWLQVNTGKRTRSFRHY